MTEYKHKQSSSLLWGCILLASLAAVMAVPQVVSAIPAFSRQTGMACTACHFQHYPAINAFGRAFKQGGFTMKGAQSMVEGEALSIPVALNASLVTKVRYQKSNGDTSATDYGELQFPDEAALLIGGRAGEHVGFLLEFATFGTADMGTGDVTGTADLGTGDVAGTADTGSGDFSLFGSYKSHFNWKVNDFNLGAVLFSTNAGGAAYGFELLNTGAQRFQRVVEDRNASSAQQFVGVGAGAAEGVALVASHLMGYVNYSLWVPEHGTTAVNGFSHYLRAAATPEIMGWDTGFGVQWFGGETSFKDKGDVDTEGWAVDAQAQGMLLGRPLGVYLAYAEAKPTATNVFNAGRPDDRTAFSVLAEIGVIPNMWTVYTGYIDGDTGAATKSEDNRLVVGTTFMVAQNVELQLSNTFFFGDKYDPRPASNGDNLTTVMLFAAF